MQFLKYIIALTILLTIASTSNAQNDATYGHFSKSYAYESEGKYALAIEELKKVKADTYALNLRLGWLSYLAGKYKEGEIYYSKAIQLRPTSVEARLGYVLPAAKLKDWSKVGLQYDAILRLDPGNYKANYYRGLMYYNTANYKQASAYLDKLTELYPFDYDAVILAAWNNYFLKKIDKAKNLFIQAKLIQPTSASANEGLKKCN